MQEVAIAAINATVSIDCGAVGPKNAYTRNLRVRKPSLFWRAAFSFNSF